jgi:hypothetical protein
VGKKIMNFLWSIRKEIRVMHCQFRTHLWVVLSFIFRSCSIPWSRCHSDDLINYPCCWRILGNMNQWIFDVLYFCEMYSCIWYNIIYIYRGKLTGRKGVKPSRSHELMPPW